MEWINSPEFYGNLGILVISLVLCIPVGYIVANILFGSRRKK